MSLEREIPHYFGAGPALLPTSVLQQAAVDLVNFQGSGLGVGEIGHRTSTAVKIIEDSKKHLAELLDIPDNYEVVFLQGGGTTGFTSVATNLAANFYKRTGKVGTAGYVITGNWSARGYEETGKLGVASDVIVDSRKSASGIKGISPVEEWKSVKADETPYIYYCDNETVDGVEFEQFPFEKYEGIPIVADMSSNLLSKTVDVSKYGLIMAGAQKNVGLAGITIYIIRKDLIEQPTFDELRAAGIPVTPSAFHFPTTVKANSTYNTIPVFTLHIVDLVLQRLIKLGGIKAQQAKNEEKASLLYQAIDSHPDVYNQPVAKNCRSKMNVIFTVKGEGNDAKFLEGAEALKLNGLKGHRSVGGLRASLYNAIELGSVQLLVKYVNEFAEKQK